MDCLLSHGCPWRFDTRCPAVSAPPSSQQSDSHKGDGGVNDVSPTVSRTNERKLMAKRSLSALAMAAGIDAAATMLVDVSERASTTAARAAAELLGRRLRMARGKIARGKIPTTCGMHFRMYGAH